MNTGLEPHSRELACFWLDAGYSVACTQSPDSIGKIIMIPNSSKRPMVIWKKEEMKEVMMIEIQDKYIIIMNNKPGKKVGDFILIEEVGSGAFGQVYKARNKITKEIVAIKCIPRFKLKQSNGIVKTLLENEIQVLQKIQNIHVVKFVKNMESQNQCYIVTEFCNGILLRQIGGDLLHYWEDQGQFFPESEVILMLKQLLIGMKALHEQNIIHRDMKLSNILRHNEILKISDFGFSKQLQTSEQQEMLRLGTLGYMAPEIHFKQPYGLEVDMFSLGVIVFQLLMGRLPFDTSSDINFLNDIQNSKILHNLDKLDWKLQKGAKISKQFINLIEQMLEIDPKKRLKWSDLFLNPLIFDKQKFSDPISEASVQADKLDPIQSLQFYQEIEQNFNANQSFAINLPQQVQEEEYSLSFEEYQQIKQQEQEVQLVFQTYKRYIQLINGLPFMKTFQMLIDLKIPDDPCIHFLASFILIKKINFLQKSFNLKMNQQYDFFSVGQTILNKVYLLPQFWDFKEQQEKSQSDIQIEMNHRLKQWAKYQSPDFNDNYNGNWRLEICSNEPSNQFSQIFKQILQQLYETQEIQLILGTNSNVEIMVYLKMCINHATFDFQQSLCAIE